MTDPLYAQLCVLARANGMNGLQLSAAAQVDPKSLYRLVNGHCKSGGNLATLRRIAAAVGYRVTLTPLPVPPNGARLIPMGAQVPPSVSAAAADHLPGGARGASAPPDFLGDA